MRQAESNRALQQFRLKRFAMALGTYALVLGLTWLTVLGGFHRASIEVALLITALVVASQLLFLLAFLTGFNQRFADPSLTLPQVLIALVWQTLFLSQLDEARGTLLVFYVVILLFGVSPLTPRLFARCAAFAFLCFCGLNLYELYIRPDVQERFGQMLLQTAVLALVLIWMSLFASYVQAMRRRMRQRRIALQAHQDTLRGMMRQLEDLVATDELTGLFNRRHFLRLAERELAALRPGAELGLALIDLDHFKQINDRYGHATGDRVLQMFARVARECLRDQDVLARYGGEEFVLLMTNTDAEQFTACCERLRRSYASAEVDEVEGSVSLSVGMALLRMGDELDEALQRADQALYRAKRNGRNRVEAAWLSVDA